MNNYLRMDKRAEVRREYAVPAYDTTTPPERMTAREIARTLIEWVILMPRPSYWIARDRLLREQGKAHPLWRAIISDHMNHFLAEEIKEHMQ